MLPSRAYLFVVIYQRKGLVITGSGVVTGEETAMKEKRDILSYGGFIVIDPYSHMYGTKLLKGRKRISSRIPLVNIILTTHYLEFYYSPTF
jgi:hypothetical protein